MTKWLGFKQDGKINTEVEKFFGIDLILGSIMVVVSTVLTIVSLAAMPLMFASFLYLISRAVVAGITLLPFRRAELLANSEVLGRTADALGQAADASRAESDMAFERIVTRRGRVNREEEDEIEDSL